MSNVLQFQEHLHFNDNHVHLQTDDDVEEQFAGHPELIAEFKRRVRLERERLRDQ